jgi:hypothetical protein
MVLRSIFLTIIIFFKLPIFAAEPTPCKCFRYSLDGSTQYAYNYLVGTNEGCCSGVAQTVASMMLYTLNEGQWQLVSVNQMTGNDAQNICCTPN